MAEILVCARTLRSHADPVKDRSGSYKRGMPVVVMPDGHEWGRLETLPDFVKIKVPGISVDKVQKYIEEWTTGEFDVLQRRRWRVRVEDMPAAALNKLGTTGELIIRAGGYTGTFDYTWQQVKTFFRNEETGLDDTVDI